MTSALLVNTFFSYIEDYVNYRETVHEASEQTVKSNLVDIRLFKKFLETQQCDRITGLTVIQFQMYLKKDRHNCGNSINRKLFSLRSYGNHIKLLEVKDAEALPFSNVLKIRGGYKSLRHALTTDQIRKLFSHTDKSSYLGFRDYCVYALMYNLGLRVGEIHGIDLDDIDHEKKQITVTGKGKRQRSLHLTDEMVRIISDWLAVRKYFLNADVQKSLFISKKGNRLAIRTIEDNFKKIVNSVDLNTNFNVTCHTLRHSFASHLNDKEVDILVLQSLLGHSSPRSTEIYIHPSEQRQREALENLPGVKYLNQLIESGVVCIKFQKQYKTRVVVNFEKLQAVLVT